MTQLFSRKNNQTKHDKFSNNWFFRSCSPKVTYLTFIFRALVIAGRINFNNLDWVEPKPNGQPLQMLAISYRLLSVLTEWPQSTPPLSIWDNASECSRTHVNRVLIQLFALTNQRSSISVLFESLCVVYPTSFPASHYYLSLDYRYTFRRGHASKLF